MVGDIRLYDALTGAGFCGPVWTESVRTLVKHGSSVLNTWSRSGRIFSVLWDKGIVLDPAASAAERRRLALDELHRRRSCAWPWPKRRSRYRRSCRPVSAGCRARDSLA
ncbi:hypothetical protein ACFVAV_11330 [Nocardia sp. NPDC057663]|uniref:hypothetical protein n=1 Tax=Nocardia sp. NPDC057663 TaxID=3346201 RepID=UPI00366FD830